MIPYNSKTELCPYGTKEMREKWHLERGIKDPRLEDPIPIPVGGSPIYIPVYRISGQISTNPPTEDPVVEQEANPPPPEGEPVGKAEPPPEDGMTKQERYRAANREKLAAKARARRAGKK